MADHVFPATLDIDKDGERTVRCRMCGATGKSLQWSVGDDLAQMIAEYAVCPKCSPAVKRKERP